MKNLRIRGAVAAWLWFTVLFANFAEALAEGRGKAQAEALRRTRHETLPELRGRIARSRLRSSCLHRFAAGNISSSDPVTLSADGEVIEGIASVDESAVTGESAPVIRESGGDRSAVTGGTRVLSDWLLVWISSDPGEGFLDRMIGLVEGARRQKTPNEIALNILLTGLTIIFLLVVSTLLPLSIYSADATGQGEPVTITVLVALLVCLIPTTIGGLLSAIGIAGMDRLIRHNVIALSGRAVEAAGDVDVLLLDKTGTITLGNRQAVEFIPLNGCSACDLAEMAQLSSLADETPEGRSIVVLAKEKYGLRGRTVGTQPDMPAGMRFVPFTAQTRMSGVDLDRTSIRQGAADAIAQYARTHGKPVPAAMHVTVERIAHSGGTPLVVAHRRNHGVIHLKMSSRGGIDGRFAERCAAWGSRP